MFYTTYKPFLNNPESCIFKHDSKYLCTRIQKLDIEIDIDSTESYSKELG